MNKMDVKKLRKSLKLNTKKFGELIAVSHRTVEHWEQGTRNPSKSALMLMKMIKLAHGKT